MREQLWEKILNPAKQSHHPKTGEASLQARMGQKKGFEATRMLLPWSRQFIKEANQVPDVQNLTKPCLHISKRFGKYFFANASSDQLRSSGRASELSRKIAMNGSAQNFGSESWKMLPRQLHQPRASHRAAEASDKPPEAARISAAACRTSLSSQGLPPSNEVVSVWPGEPRTWAGYICKGLPLPPHNYSKAMPTETKQIQVTLGFWPLSAISEPSPAAPF